MSVKVTLTVLAERVAPMCGVSTAEAEVLIKSYFDIVEETLLSGDNVKVKGLGTFKCVGIEARESVDVNTGNRVVIPGHRRATFTPEKGLAERVNAPFAAFETVELSDDISEAELDEIGSEKGEDVPIAERAVDMAVETAVEAAVEAPEVVSEEMPIESAVEMAETAIEVDSEVDSEPEVDSEVEPEPAAAPEIEDNPEAAVEEMVSEAEESEVYDSGENRRGGGRFIMGFLIGMVSMLVVLVGFWCWYRFAPESFDSVLGRPASVSAPVAAKVVAPVDKKDKAAVAIASVGGSAGESVAAEEAGTEEERPEVEQKAEVPTEPSDAASKAPVYDTISTTRFLTTMARDHYGSYHLWPYIYMENSKILGHPDRIKPGTRVVIPPAEKYGINAKDKGCVAKAKKLGVEIYARYK